MQLTTYAPSRVSTLCPREPFAYIDIVRSTYRWANCLADHLKNAHAPGAHFFVAMHELSDPPEVVCRKVVHGVYAGCMKGASSADRFQGSTYDTPCNLALCPWPFLFGLFLGPHLLPFGRGGSENVGERAAALSVVRVACVSPVGGLVLLFDSWKSRVSSMTSFMANVLAGVLVSNNSSIKLQNSQRIRRRFSDLKGNAYL